MVAKIDESSGPTRRSIDLALRELSNLKPVEFRKAEELNVSIQDLRERLLSEASLVEMEKRFEELYKKGRRAQKAWLRKVRAVTLLFHANGITGEVIERLNGLIRESERGADLA